METGWNRRSPIMPAWSRPGRGASILFEFGSNSRPRPPVRAPDRPRRRVEAPPDPPAARPTPEESARMRRMRPYATLVALLLPALAAAQQSATGRVTGTVTEATSGRPVGDANVVVVGARLGASTNAEGRYVINGVPA